MLTLKRNKITLNGNTPDCKTKHRRQKRDDNAPRYEDGIKLNAEYFFRSVPVCDFRSLAECGVHHSPFLSIGILSTWNNTECNSDMETCSGLATITCQGFKILYLKKMN